MKAEELKPSPAGRAQNARFPPGRKDSAALPSPAETEPQQGPSQHHPISRAVRSPMDGAQLESPAGTWITGTSDSLVDVGVGVVGENVVLSPEDLHGLLGIFLQLKHNQQKPVLKAMLLLLHRHKYPSSCGVPGPPEEAHTTPTGIYVFKSLPRTVIDHKIRDLHKWCCLSVNHCKCLPRFVRHSQLFNHTHASINGSKLFVPSPTDPLKEATTSLAQKSWLQKNSRSCNSKNL